MLYEEQLALAPILCLQCAAYFVCGERGPHACPECGEHLDERLYEEWFRHAFYAVRFGYQYRSHAGAGAPADAAAPKPFLPPLGEVFTFMGMAAIGCINGGATRERSRLAIRRIVENWNAISGEAERLELDDEAVDAFIDCLAGYYRDIAGLKDGMAKAGEAAPDAARPPLMPLRASLWNRLKAPGSDA